MRGDDGAIARQRQTQRLGQAVHGVGGEHARTAAAGGTGGLLHLQQLSVGNVGIVTGHQSIKQIQLGTFCSARLAGLHGAARNKDRGDDLLHNSVVKILEKLNFGLSSIDNLSAYMYKIISNTWKDELRKKYRNVEVHVDEMVYNNLPDLETSNYDGNIDTLNEIKDKIKSLSLKLREVLILVTLENKSYKETAEILNIPIGTVMSRLNEARKKLSGQKKNQEIKEVN